MIKHVPKSYKPTELESKIEKNWEDSNAYEYTREARKNGKDFYFIDGPPYTSGAIHLGTAWNKILKDAVIRYRRMTGHNVRDQAGYDMHGLPIEVQVEKEMGFKQKQDIKNFGMENFIGKCREFALKHKDKMTEQFKALGVWLDWENPYITITNDYINSAWWTLKRAHEQNLLTRAERVLTWCPRCETALAEAEVEYWDETDHSIYVRFPVEGKENEYILIWTTTPWTLPADVAVTLHPDFKYARVKFKKGAKEEIFILVENRVDDIKEIGEYDDYEILEKIDGQDLEGLKYVHPLCDEVPYHQQEHDIYYLHRIVLADYVTDDMTGCVHTAPGHGPDDFETGQRYELPAFCPIDEAGVFTEEGGKYAGKFTKDTDDQIIQELWDKGLMLWNGKITHRYGHCWRCKTPITYRATKQWFLKVTELRDRMLEEISRIRWVPEWAGSSRQYLWVENTRDWCISRQRYWGIPLPIWLCGACGQLTVIGEARDLEGQEGYEPAMDLHRPWIDNVKIKCPKCGELVPRVVDVMDVWFDSAVCSWAQLGFPVRDDEFKRWWPCDWITEAHDQTRGWFYSQLGASVIAFDKIPYEAVLMHGWALDKEGKPMSKSAGNAVDPLDITEKYGVDAFRFYFLRASAPWDDIPFNDTGVSNSNRMLNILWNVYLFSTTYMALDKFDPEKKSYEELSAHLKPEDKWLYSVLESLKKTVTDELEEFNMHKVCRAIEFFINEDLSRWYIRLVRDRLWIEAEDVSKLSAYRTIYDVLLDLAKLMAPITPYISEEIYLNLDHSKPTIHASDWPVTVDTKINTTLENQMKIVREIVEAVFSARQTANLKLRWPCKRIIINAEYAEISAAVNTLEEILRNQTNTKEIEVLPPGEVWGEAEIDIQPQFKVLGPVFKEKSKAIVEALKTQDGQTIKTALAEGNFEIDIEGEKHEVTPEMVKITQKLPENIVGATFSGGLVYLDTELTPELRAEGFARELVRRIQEMRKEMDLKVEDSIDTVAKVSTELEELLKNWHEYISTETRSIKLEISSQVSAEGTHTKDWLVNEEKLVLGLTKHI
ncbi:isoleucine--tRNA ligase [[Eubacterium] cellulosolvens]